MNSLEKETKNIYKKIDLELIQDSPDYAAELIGRYREEQELLVGALKLIAEDETDWPEQLAKNVLDKVLGAEDECWTNRDSAWSGEDYINEPRGICLADEYRRKPEPEEKKPWHPIETAPLNGNHILLYRKCIQFVGYYGGANSGWRINAPDLPAMWPLPTHWKPLPKIPDGE